MKTIAHYKEILSNEVLRYTIIKDELLEIKEKYGDERRSEIVYAGDDLKIEDMIADENVVITISHMGISNVQTLLNTDRKAERKRSKGSSTRDEDFIEHMSLPLHTTIYYCSPKRTMFLLRVTKCRKVINKVKAERSRIY